MHAFPRHFDGKRYFNPGGPKVRGFSDLLKWQFSAHREKSPSFVDDVTPCKPPESVSGTELRVTLINHSTVLLQQDGLNLLTDPVWSERVSPVLWAGPRRHRAAGVRFEDLPRIDAILLSHNHYDHLDLSTLRRLADRGNIPLFVPMGLARLIRSHHPGPVNELDWGDSLPIGKTTVHCVPAFHFSSRGLFDSNRTLWCGYMVESPGRLIYFAADTAFGDHFAWIRERFGPPGLALLPIGAYEPRWFMSPVHMGPDDAVRAHRILGAGTSIAIHHGTFQLADESIDTPRRLLEEQKEESFLVLANGQSVTIS